MVIVRGVIVISLNTENWYRIINNWYRITNTFVYYNNKNGDNKNGNFNLTEYWKLIQNIEKQRTDIELLLTLFTIKLTNGDSRTIIVFLLNMEKWYRIFLNSKLK